MKRLFSPHFLGFLVAVLGAGQCAAADLESIEALSPTLAETMALYSAAVQDALDYGGGQSAAYHFGGFPDQYENSFGGRIPPDPYFRLNGTALSQHPPRRSLPPWLPAVVYALLAPVYFLPLRKSLSKRRCYHALLCVMGWLVGMAVAVAAGWVYEKASGGAYKWEKLYQDGSYYLPAIGVSFAALTVFLRKFPLGVITLALLCAFAASAIPMAWANQRQPAKQAYRLAGPRCRLWIARDGSRYFLISRGPNGRIEVGEDIALAALSIDDSATSATAPTAPINWERLAPYTYDPTNGAESLGDIFHTGYGYF